MLRPPNKNWKPHGPPVKIIVWWVEPNMDSRELKIIIFMNFYLFSHILKFYTKTQQTKPSGHPLSGSVKWRGHCSWQVLCSWRQFKTSRLAGILVFFNSLWLVKKRHTYPSHNKPLLETFEQDRVFSNLQLNFQCTHSLADSNHFGSHTFLHGKSLILKTNWKFELLLFWLL